MLGTTGLCTIDKTAVRVLSDSIFYILHSLWLNILNFILEDSLNIIFEELIGKMRRILKLERIRTEWETEKQAGWLLDSSTVSIRLFSHHPTCHI